MEIYIILHLWWLRVAIRIHGTTKSKQILPMWIMWINMKYWNVGKRTVVSRRSVVWFVKTTKRENNMLWSSSQWWEGGSIFWTKMLASGIITAPAMYHHDIPRGNSHEKFTTRRTRNRIPITSHDIILREPTTRIGCLSPAAPEWRKNMCYQWTRRTSATDD